MKRVLLILILSSGALTCLYAQTLTRTNVVRVTLRGSGAIFQEGQVKGYYSFYDLEKKDKKNNNYQLSVYDENLREINSINITRPRTYVVVDGAFNGTTFCFLFYDSKNRINELVSFDRTLKQTGSYSIPVKNKYTLANYNLIAQGGNLSQAYLIGVQDKGFLYYGLKEKEYHYQTDFFDNTMKKVWSDQAPVEADIEIASEAFQQVQYIGSLITSKKTKSSKDIDVDLVVQRVEDGKKLFRVPVATNKYSVALSNVYFDQASQNFIVFGEYYDKKDKELKAQSLGFISVAFDLNGKIVSEKTNSWATDISRVTPVNEKGKFDGSNTSVLFHDIIRTNDGQFFAVGEQYKKAASGAGIALQILNVAAAAAGGGYSSTSSASVQLNVYNLVIFQFNPDFTINKIHFFEKDKNVVMLPAGSGFMSPKQISFYAKAVGGFDYVYSQESKDKSTFVVTYVNYDREKGEKAKNLLGSVIYTPEKTFTVDKLVLNRKSSDYYIYRAKEGYVMVTEYFKKEKKIESRLEKLNY